MILDFIMYEQIHYEDKETYEEEINDYKVMRYINDIDFDRQEEERLTDIERQDLF